MIIRPLERADIATLRQIDLAGHGEQWSVRTFEAQIDDPEHTHVVGVGELDGELIGHASATFHAEGCSITNVAVAEPHRRRGHGAALLGAVLDAVVDDPGATSLQLEVRPANRAAQQLYRRFGFAPVGVLRNFYRSADAAGSRDALVMRVDDTSDAAWRSRLSPRGACCR